MCRTLSLAGACCSPSSAATLEASNVMPDETTTGRLMISSVMGSVILSSMPQAGVRILGPPIDGRRPLSRLDNTATTPTAQFTPCNVLIL